MPLTKDKTIYDWYLMTSIDDTCEVNILLFFSVVTAKPMMWHGNDGVANKT